MSNPIPEKPPTNQPDAEYRWGPTLWAALLLWGGAQLFFLSVLGFQDGSSVVTPGGGKSGPMGPIQASIAGVVSLALGFYFAWHAWHRWRAHRLSKPAAPPDKSTGDRPGL
jgi:hypothetical protein